jgi:hypothetical protein
MHNRESSALPISRQSRPGLQPSKMIKENPAEARKIIAQYAELPEAVVQATPFPTFRFAIKPDDIQASAAAPKDVGQLDREVDRSKLVVTP